MRLENPLDVLSAMDPARFPTSLRTAGFHREPGTLVRSTSTEPGIDGWEVYQQMKTEDELRDIPVIVVTARAQTMDKVLGLHIAKVDDYLTKPLGPGQLRRSVDRVLGRAM